MARGSSAQKPCVAQVIESMGMGGAENLAVRIANSLAADGYRSHLIVIGEPGILSSRISPTVSVHYLKFERASINFPPAFVLSLRRGAALLSDVIVRNEIQVIQTHLPGANFWGLLLAWRKVCPVLATIHNNREFQYGDQDNPVRAAFRKKAYKLILQKCAGAVAVSEEVKSSLISDLGVGQAAADVISVVTNGVDIPEPLLPELSERIRRQLGVDAHRPIILAAGRFSEQKNFEDLVEAAILLRAENPDFQMVIGGDGPMWADLKAKVFENGLGEHILMPGNLTNLNEVMQAADIFVMSSLWEGLPLVLLEAMAAGLPSVAYDIAGVDEIIESGTHGITVPTANVASLTSGLVELLAREDKRRSMGQAARELVEERYSFSLLMDRLQGLYHQVAQT